MNSIHLIGRTTASPELKTTTSGKSVTTFTLAVNRRSDRDKTDFIRIVVWNALAENVNKYVSKGQQIAVSGELHIRPWEKNGEKHLSAEVVADEVEFLAKADAKNKPTSDSELFAEEFGYRLDESEDFPY